MNTCGVTRTPCTPAVSLSIAFVQILYLSSRIFARSAGGTPLTPTLAIAQLRAGSAGGEHARHQHAGALADHPHDLVVIERGRAERGQQLSFRFSALMVAERDGETGRREDGETATLFTDC